MNGKLISGTFFIAILLLMPTVAAECEKPGDVNEDGQIDDQDLAILSAYLSAGEGSISMCADYDKNGVVDETDFICMDLLLRGDLTEYESAGCPPLEEAGEEEPSYTYEILYSTWDGNMYKYSSEEGVDKFFTHQGARLYPVAADIDGDGKKELVSGAKYPKWLAVFNNDLTPFRIGRDDTWVDISFFKSGPTFRMAPIRNYDNPNKDSILIVYPRNSWIGILEYDAEQGKFVPEITPKTANGWYRYSTKRYSSYPGAGDIDGDGKDEIVLATNARSGWLFIYDDDREPMEEGTSKVRERVRVGRRRVWVEKPGWLKTGLRRSNYITPDFADLDGDGREDFIINDKRTLVGYGFDGAQFKRLFTYKLSSRNDGFSTTWAVWMGDANSDGVTDIIVGSFSRSSLVNVYHYNPNVLGGLELVWSFDAGKRSWSIPVTLKSVEETVCCVPYCDDGPDDCSPDNCDTTCGYRTEECPCPPFCHPDPDCGGLT